MEDDVKIEIELERIKKEFSTLKEYTLKQLEVSEKYIRSCMERNMHAMNRIELITKQAIDIEKGGLLNVIETELVDRAMRTIEIFLNSNVKNEVINRSQDLIREAVRKSSTEDMTKAISMIDARVSAKRFEAEVSKVIEQKMSSEIKKLIRNIELPAETIQKAIKAALLSEMSKEKHDPA